MSHFQTHLFESLETYKDLFDHAHDIIHLVHVDSNIIYVNNAWLSLLGYNQEEVKGRSIYSFVDEHDRTKFIQYRESIINGNTTSKEVIIHLITKDDRRVAVEGSISAKLHEGKTIYTRGIFRDVTVKLKNEAELKAINEELQERQLNLQRLLYYAPDAIIVIDAQSTITFWNPKAEEIFGWTATEVKGRSLTGIIVPEQYREAHDKGMRRYLTTGEAHVLNKTIEITALHKNGKEFFISLTISTTQQKGEVAFIAFVRDIDEQKKNALELEQKKKELEASNQELEQFAHVASHDMKEPIRKILIFTEQLKNDPATLLSPKSMVYINKVEKATERLTKMVEGVLLYASVRSEDILNEKVDLNEIMRSVENDLELIIEQKSAVIEYHDLPLIHGASFLLYQLFYNLINNALKFSKPDTGTLIQVTSRLLPDDQLSTYLINKPGTYAEIIIRDNGIGFSQEYAEKIFKTFYRLHSKESYEGTGLGLALCKSIVEKHGGGIKAYGEEGAGAAFSVALPLAQHHF